MASIAFLTAHSAFPWQRQLETGSQGDMDFTLGREAPDCVLAVVYDEPPANYSTCLPRERRMIVLSEPPGVKRYPARYLDQFGLVMGPIDPGRHGGEWLAGHPALPWFYGIGFTEAGLVVNLTFDELGALSPPPKIAKISAVLSTKAQTRKHRARLAFCDALDKRLGSRFEIFGRGFQDISDKAEAIAPFAYHLVLENNDIPHFWTEKTADAFLGWSLPVFSGCPNIGDYFPEGSFLPIDIARTDEALDQIEQILDTDPYREHLPMIVEARQRLLGPYNLANRLREIAANADATTRSLSPAAPLKPTTAFSLYHAIRKTIGRGRK